jgi:hypothetical protein
VMARRSWRLLLVSVSVKRSVAMPRVRCVLCHIMWCSFRVVL